jgi:arsenate reductase
MNRTSTQVQLFALIENFIKTINTDTIAFERREALQPIIDFIQNKLANNQEIRLNFICTHNSRRSHLAQIWGQTMAFYFNIKNVFCYSAGTERTAIYPTVISTLKNIGFEIEAISLDDNPIYSIKFTDNAHPIIGFSKKLDHNFNPKTEFAALMTCSQADGGCPFIIGAEKRIPLLYVDPKTFDNTPLENKKYHERSLQIASEFYYIFSNIKTQL